MTLKVSGRLDTTTAPSLETAVSEVVGVCENLVLDFAGLEYISSAGLRVILKAQKAMAAKGGMKVLHVNETIMEIFEITGFSDILTIE
jgi:anti-sigma B factor antagonist